jgi:tetratricopeptide (TPR) repeat protein
MGMRTALAAALHQSGDLTQSALLFAEAEKMQAEWQPDYPILYSLQGYQYCELIRTQGRVDDVERRATQTLEWSMHHPFLVDIALDHLSLGHFDEAVQGLRHAGHLHQLPRGLLARGAHFRRNCEFEKAQRDLDEVRILATRSGMRLFLTDYHLEHARLHLAQSKPDEARPHYEAAKKLVDETGYHRRDREVEELGNQLE